MESIYHSYILHSKTLGKYYIGACGDDLEGRINTHLSNHKGFTSRAKDWELVYVEKYLTKQEAFSRENQIKKWKSKKMVERLISSGN